MTGAIDPETVYALPRSAGRKILLILLGLWIFGGAVFYFVRFTFEFYYANRESIEALVRTALE